MIVCALFLLTYSVQLNSRKMKAGEMTIAGASDYSKENVKKVIDENIEKITIADGAPVQAYSGFNYVKELLIETSSITKIPDKMFYGNNIIQTVTLPASVDTIGQYAFAFSSIQTINLGSVTKIEENAFENCQQLSINSFHNDLSMAAYAFSGSGISSIIIKDCPKFLCCKCLKLSEVTILSTCTSIDEHAFAYCSQLTQIHFDQDISSLFIFAYSFYASGSFSVSLPNAQSIYVYDNAFALSKIQKFEVKCTFLLFHGKCFM